MTRLGRAIDGRPRFTAASGQPISPRRSSPRRRPLLRLDAPAAANALALALTLAAPGVGHHNAQTTARWFAVGNAARNGLSAAMAAKAGFTSDLKLIEGNFLSGVYGVTPDGAALTAGLGEAPALAEVSFKPGARRARPWRRPRRSRRSSRAASRPRP
jgi:hypothetical protein